MPKLLPLLVAVLVLVFTPLALATPDSGGSCSGCHAHSINNDGRLSMASFDAQANPTEVGHPDQGTLKVYQATPGSTEQITLAVSGLGQFDTYSVAFKDYGATGVTANGLLHATGDNAWTPQLGSAYYSLPTQTYTSGTATFHFNLGVGAAANQDYYLLSVMLAAPNGYFDEQKFYVQVVPEPMTISVLVGSALLGLRRKRR